MAPVATTEQTLQSNGTPKKAVSNGIAKVFNPFYSPPASDENDGTYKFAHYKVRLMPSILILMVNVVSVRYSRPSQTLSGLHWRNKKLQIEDSLPTQRKTLCFLPQPRFST